MNSKPLLKTKKKLYIISECLSLGSFLFINTVEEAIWNQTVNIDERETIHDVR